MTRNKSSGANNREQMYSSTLPLLIEVEHTGSKSTNPWCRMSYSANFYTPHFWGIVATPNEWQIESKCSPTQEELSTHYHFYTISSPHTGSASRIPLANVNSQSLRQSFMPNSTLELEIG
ncbi:hypothetical protein CEXT_479951 [Caerostris extrusa]|uniref:Uncharacterized protein n=1 Tax=Caerostris extrusa TaxID=172846 RepID=A0AAV4RNG2_CAEEX|nr:hypothetical protein CEXT_479951 [Caerostris extrusa]